jgi:chemotaxis signal transduction protein
MTATASPSGSTDPSHHNAEVSDIAQRVEDHCIFECSGRVFAVPLSAVREVLSGKLATPVPQAPPALVGVVEMHGDALAVVQLSALLGTAARPYTPANPIVVLCAHSIVLGVAVDRVRQVRSIDPHSLSPSTHAFSRGSCPGTPPLIVLDAKALVTRALHTAVVRPDNVSPSSIAHAQQMNITSVLGSS